MWPPVGSSAAASSIAALTTGSVPAPVVHTTRQGAAPPMRFELEAYEPTADPAAIVIVGGVARFTVLSPQLVRMEYSAGGTFEDRPTLAFVHRKQPVPPFAWNGKDTLTTANLTLTYSGGPFSAASLSVRPSSASASSSSSSSSSWTWRYGMTSAADHGNLRGTMSSLDSIANITLDCAAAAAEEPRTIYDPAGDVNRSRVSHCEFGVASRSGWALVDDSHVPALDEDDWWTDGAGRMHRSRGDVDLYLFGHGHDYRAAVKDLNRVGGRVPLLPRRNLGVWWTRWYDFDSTDVAAVPAQFARRSLPLDVLVLDMNWHTKRSGWGGYSWDETLHPRPSEMLGQLRGEHAGLGVALNLHDSSGIGTSEDTFAEVSLAMGRSAPNLAFAPIGLDLTNKSYVYALEDATLARRESEGVDFFWIDWQQGDAKGNTGQDGPRGKMNPIIWLNKMRATSAKRRCVLGIKGASSSSSSSSSFSSSSSSSSASTCEKRRRGVVLGRYGGLGNQRYQHGFSGDVLGLTWANLAYQAYFSATASNVNFGFWSHDVSGPGNDHEMYTRWLQLAAYQPIMRMHDRGKSAGKCRGWPTESHNCATDRPYAAPMAFTEVNEEALRTRAALVPYAYTAAREAHDSGLGLTRPLYYYWPEQEGAYPESMDASLGQTPGTRQYMFGPSLLVAPVSTWGDCPQPRGSDTLEAPCGLAQLPICARQIRTSPIYNVSAHFPFPCLPVLASLALPRPWPPSFLVVLLQGCLQAPGLTCRLEACALGRY